ncbi:MAG: glycoside hydrolase family 25 protein [Lachnospiraceae bacterium]|nr:glycoside hydrolase family 25 protein [Lachnospiraceae bacterium]
MRLEDDYEEYDDDQPSESNRMLKHLAVGVFVALAAVIGIVAAINYEKGIHKKIKTEDSSMQANTQDMDKEVQALHESVQALVENDGLTSDQLDFWDIYKDSGEEQDENSVSTDDSSTKKSEEESTTTASDGTTDAETDHVNQTMIESADGTEEWVNISPFITKNKYDVKNFEYKAPVMKYYDGGKCISYLGVDISKDTGEVDFHKLKKAGVQFVMIRAGARGYGTGQLELDSAFLDNLQGATEAGLDIGVTFYSQAITKDEAVEEATLVYDHIQEYLITYPIAFDMEKVSGDIARTDRLTREEKSNIALNFLDALKAVGYKGIIYGNKEWLIKEINLSTVGSYDIWLSQSGDTPDYPYKFSMWQYTQRGTIDGIKGDAHLNICFINYNMK